MTQRDESALNDADAARIDAMADEFEQELRTGRSTRVEAFLNRVDENVRPAALRELLKVEIELRRARQESVSVNDYQHRFAGLESVVVGVFDENNEPVAQGELRRGNSAATEYA